MLRTKLIALPLGLGMLYAPCQAEYLAEAYRLAQSNLFLQEDSRLLEGTARFKHDSRTMFGLAVGGLKESFSARSPAYWGAGACLTLATYSQDKRIQRFFQERHPLRRVSRIGDVSGTILNSGLPGLALYGAGRFAGNGELAELGKVMLATTVVKWGLTSGLIFTVRRERPEKRNLSLFEGGRASFPSGHVAGAFATATVLNEFYGPRMGVPAYLLATFVGLSRLDDNKHYASDVVGGAAVGTMAAAAVSRATRTRWAGLRATPAVQEKGVGLALVYRF